MPSNCKELQQLPKFPAYFDHKKGRYLVETQNGWINLSKEDLLLRLRQAGFPNQGGTSNVTPIQLEFIRIQTHNKIDYAGPIAGYRKGLVSMGGSQILVTQSFSEIAPTKTPWPLLGQFLANLFDRIDPAQKLVFFSWCALYLRSLKANIFMPGQAMVLAGPHNCGKSFLQNLLTLLFGGRSANPWPYMSGATEFNSELFAAEHQQAEDPAVRRLAERLDFSARVKQFTVNEIQPCHGKNRDIITVKPRWRLTISINDDPFLLRAIPPIDDSTADKFIIFKCAKDSVPFNNPDVLEREKFRRSMEAELPGFAYFLLNEWETPVTLRCGRFGVVHYHHPEILTEINSQSPEFELLSTVDDREGWFFDDSPEWGGSAKDLCAVLAEIKEDPEAIRFSKNLRNVQLFLTSLARKLPHRVRQDRTKKTRVWVITKQKAARN